MEWTTTTLLAILVVSLVIWLRKTFNYREQNLPRGLRGFTAVKFLVNCVRYGFHTESSDLMREWKTDLFSIDLFGMKTFVVFGSQEKQIEAYQKKGDYLLRRPPIPAKPDTVGLVACDGAFWKEQRHFSLTTLRDIGMGKSNLEQRIQDEVQNLLDVLSETCGKSLDPLIPIGTAFVNVIASVVYSLRFEHGDPNMSVMLQNFNNLASGSHILPLMTLSMFENFFELPLIKRKVVEQRMKTDIARKIIKERIEEAQRTGVGNDERNDYAAAFMKEMKRRESEGEESSFTERQLLESVEDLFGAGAESGSTTLRWGVLCMAHHPDVQNKVYEELKENLSSTEGLPSYSERERTPYTNAVILEVLRLSTFAILNVRYSNSSVKLFGYEFEAGTTFVANYWHINHDERIWEKPNEFFPGHFLNEDGQVVNKEKYSPFGLGKRQCSGESLARMEQYLFFSALILNFEFRAPDGVPLPPLSRSNTGAVRAPLSYEVCAVKRK